MPQEPECGALRGKGRLRSGSGIGGNACGLRRNLRHLTLENVNAPRPSETAVELKLLHRVGTGPTNRLLAEGHSEASFEGDSLFSA